MDTLQKLNQALEIEKESRSKLTRKQSYFKLNPSGSRVRILPLLDDDKNFCEVVREHWIRREDSTRNEISEKFTCWYAITNGRLDYSGCPFCVAIEKITNLLETEKYDEEDYNFLSSLISGSFEKKTFAKIDQPRMVWYLYVVDCNRPIQENPLIWGCNQASIQTGINLSLNLYKKLADPELGNDLHISRKDNNYIVIPAQARALTDSEMGCLLKRKSFKSFHDHKISLDEAVKIVEGWVDLGQDWFKK